MRNDYQTTRPKIGIGEAELDVGQFPSSFIKVVTYSEISNSNTVFISGRKGSGKSALCIEFEDSEKEKYSSIFSMKKDSLDYHNFRTTRSRLLRNQGLEEDIRYITRHAWYLTIIINLMIFVSTKENNSTDIEILSIKSFLTEDNWFDFGRERKLLAFVAKIIDYFTKTKIASEAEEALSEYIDSDSLLVAVRHLRNYLDKQNKPVVMLIDDIDSQLSSVTSEEERKNAISYIDGLVNSCQALRYPTLSEKFHIKAFVPQDLFGQVNERHSDKIAASSRNVKWHRGELFKMIVTRLYSNLPEAQRRQYDVNRDADLTRIWGHFFPEKVYVADARLRAPHPFESHKIILSYTLQRPRDLVILCDSIFDETCNSGEKFVTERNIWEGINRYSIQLVRNLSDEYSSVHTGIGDIIQSFSHGKRHYTKSDLTLHLNKIPQVGGNEKQVNSLIDTLYNAGFLGVISTMEEIEPAPGHPETKEEYYYDRMNTSANSAENFVIHRAFGKALQIQMGMGVR